MATATSSSISRSSAGTAFRILFGAIDSLDRMSEAASTAFFTPSVGHTEDSISQVTVSDLASQVTVKNAFVASSTLAGSTVSVGSGNTTDQGVTGGFRPVGLPPDNEGKETRKSILDRRRKECAAEEVDVALAPVMKINVPYCFYPDQYKAFRKMFPRVSIDSGLAYTHHDHPVAHTATMIGIRYVQGMLQPGHIVLDLHGNPNGNEQFNRFQSSRVRKRPSLPKPPIMETMVEERVAADAVRRITKWGDEIDKETGLRRYHKWSLDDIPDGLYDTYTSIHTLYYYSMYEVCKLMNRPKSKGKLRLHALVNYSKEQTGELYGELRFSKSGGTTVQTSPNGEKYLHPDIDQWFQTNSFRPVFDTLGGGIAWTSTHVGGPLYVITITSCDYETARLHRYDPPGAPTLKVEHDRSFLGFVRIGGKEVRLRISNADLAGELRHFMTFRDRSNPQVFEDLVVKARRVTSKDLVDGSRQFKVADGELQDHIVYAFLVDAPGELELMDGVKLLRGDLLEPLAAALRQMGPERYTPYLAAMFQWLTGQSLTKGALTSKGRPARRVQVQNSGGLLPISRT